MHTNTVVKDHNVIDIFCRIYNASDIKQACSGADVAIACLGTSTYWFIEL